MKKELPNIKSYEKKKRLALEAGAGWWAPPD